MTINTLTLAIEDCNARQYSATIHWRYLLPSTVINVKHLHGVVNVFRSRPSTFIKLALRSTFYEHDNNDKYEVLNQSMVLYCLNMLDELSKIIYLLCKYSFSLLALVEHVGTLNFLLTR